MTEAELFDRALNVATEERDAFLDRECAGDAALRARLEKLLAAHDRAIAAEVANPIVRASVPDIPLGSLLAGKYKLVEEIGEGGMGRVYLAQQTDPVKRNVAVKVIKAGMDTKVVLARFEAERQALAMMDHPNIARVLDAGATENGRPYFVMELVKGVPITQYCDDQKRTPRQRLELFVPVCLAIQHAHQKGIIHRDIKPSNVLVAMYDDRPVPKVIDFGVAKATGQSLTENTLITGFGSVVGTPEYMSPEQANLNNLDIDTRSDVYSLGVLLYELLTGTTPVDRKNLGRAALLEVLRAVRDVEAPKPSAKLSTDAALPSLSANRGTEPKKLTSLLRHELDWIVLKALEKDRSRRYESASSFAADAQRYLHNEPVTAHPPTRRYRLGKAITRNKTATVVAFSVVCILIGATVVSLSSWAAYVRNDSRQQWLIAEGLAQLKQKTQLRVEQEKLTRARAESWSPHTYRYIARQNAAPFTYPWRRDRPGQSQDQVEFARAISRIGPPDRNLIPDTPVKNFPPGQRYCAAWHWGYGIGFRNVDEFDEAVGHLKKAIEFAEAGFGPADEITLEILKDLALTYHYSGDGRAAYREILRGDEAYRRVRGTENHTNASAKGWGELLSVAAILTIEIEGRLPEADLWKRSLALSRPVVDTDPRHQSEFGSLYHTALEIIRNEGRFADTARVYQKVIRDAELNQRPTFLSERYRIELAMEFARVLIDAKNGHLLEAEQILLTAYLRARALIRFESDTLDAALPDDPMRWSISLYKSCLERIIHLYRVMDKPAERDKWIAEYREYERKTNVKGPGKRFDR